MVEFPKKKNHASFLPVFLYQRLFMQKSSAEKKRQAHTSRESPKKGMYKGARKKKSVVHERFQNIYSCFFQPSHPHSEAEAVAESGASNDRFLSNAFKLCFRLSRVLSKLRRLILGCAKKNLFVRLFT